MNKKGQINFSFIARYPSAILVAGGVLAALMGNGDLGFALIGLGVILHIMWLRR